MGYTRQKGHMLDLVVSRRLVGTCWLLAALGIATMQMRLLAQVWHESALVLVTALAASAWMLGAVASLQRPNTQRIWGACFAAGVFLWFLSPLISLRVAPAFLHLTTLVGLLAAAFILGFCSTAWLNQRRGSAIGEQFTLSRTLVSGTVGLVLVWLLPNASWSGGVGFVLLTPLLALDAWPQARSPLLIRGGSPTRLLLRTTHQYPGGTGPQLDTEAMPRGWWLRYLAARERLPLTLLASGSTIVLGGIWSTIPTPFASALAEVHQLGKLEWLLGGQLVALAAGFSSLAWLGLGEVVASHPLLLDILQSHARSAVILLLMAMSAGLLALGLPFLQDPWSLGAILGGYTLAALLWGRLLPRLLPSISTEISAQQHVYRHLAVSRLLPLRQSEEDLANRNVLIAEAWLSAILAPVFGWLVDLFTVDRLLLFLGTTLLATLAAVATAFAFDKRPQQPPSLRRWLG